MNLKEYIAIALLVSGAAVIVGCRLAGRGEHRPPVATPWAWVMYGFNSLLLLGFSMRFFVEAAQQRSGWGAFIGLLWLFQAGFIFKKLTIPTFRQWRQVQCNRTGS